MKYGYFDDDAREYVITNPTTPLKWINYIGTLSFGGLVDHTGGMLICQGDPALNRIIKYIPQLPDSDFKGSTLYLRYQSEPESGVFSPYYVPTLDNYDRFECHIGLGYSRFISEMHSLRTEITIFVPVGDHRVIWDISITNLADHPIEVDAIPVVEYTHFDALKQFNNADWVPQTMQSKALAVDESRIILTQFAFMRKDTCINILTSNLPVSSFESERRAFLGNNGYGTWTSPLALQQAELNNSEAQRSDNIGALMHHLGKLQPGEAKRLIVQITQAATVEEALPGIRQFWEPTAVDQAFDNLKTFWEQYLAVFQVETPNASMNSMLNVHNPRQCHTTKNWSRYLSLYQLGLGARGIGFRDSSQDVLGVMVHMPEEAADFIRQLLHVQRCDGSAMHQYNPLTMIGNEGEARFEDEAPQYYGDDHLWIILAVCSYLKETGNLAFLDEVIPFYDKDKHNHPIESGTIWEHINRGIDFTRTNVGTHGLPLLGFADWNDTVNLAAGAESLFIANLYGRALHELITLSKFRNDNTSVEKFEAYYREMQQRVNEHAWDGEWYIRYYDAEGAPIGSHTNKKGQIYVNGQSWAVLSGFAPPERARQALDSAYERLNTRNGIKVSAPGYTAYDPKIGGISTFPPGAKENGGIFMHTNPWMIIAEATMGNGDRAFQYYDQMNPAAKNDCIDEYECEPYVYAQNILADTHPQFGAARNSWLSGTASWAYQAATQFILGIKPTYSGLRIDPCVPTEWDGFTAIRRFRNAVYKITVTNPDHISGGVKSIILDGKTLEGTILPILDDGKSHRVEVTLG